MPINIDTIVKSSESHGYHAKPKSLFTRIVYLPLAISSALLIFYGMLVCWSATSSNADYSFMRQIMGIAMGLICMCIFWAYDYRRLANAYLPLLAVSVVLILMPHLPVIGVTAKGATSWINIGMQLQPGEFAKITIVLFAASLLSKYEGRLDNLKEYCKVVGLLLIPFFCIMTQPDLGTGLVYLFIGATTLVMAGARLKYLLVTLAIIVVCIVAIFIIDEFLKYQTEDGSYEYRLLKQYQRSRLLVFMNQDAVDKSRDGYNLKQAMIAIGSGGLFGKGLGSSTQSSLGFLPEAPTDFVFCVLAEEFGFVGVLVLLAFYISLIVAALHIARSCDNFFGMLLICAIVGMWIFQILENVGMCCGLMPITGIPLPFVSYGSSFMLVNFALLGFIGSVYTHEHFAGRMVK